ncbi:glutathione peroxidase [Bdellovibrio sp. HCB290]|uniref:glutathione peroxidase n=1 Tax=Bdellovibrio sp. HCB290 TaxID=3394356 RepID=UPI0039B474E7
MSTSLNHIEFNTADGKKAKLADFSGNVLLVVNVASECGLTPQYEGLEKVHQKYESKGLRVLGFPANEFGAQEPGSNEQIQEFCRTQFGVKFPVFAKMVVKGEGQHPLYQQLTSLQPTAQQVPNGKLKSVLEEHGLLSGGPSDIMWNFEKFLISKEGKVIARFTPEMTPEDPVILKAIEMELAR